MVTSWWTDELLTSQKGCCMGLLQPWIKFEYPFMRCVRTVSVRGSGSWRQFPVSFAILHNSFVQVINYAFFLFVSGKLVSFPWNWLFVYIRWQTVVSGCLLLCQLVRRTVAIGHEGWGVFYWLRCVAWTPCRRIRVCAFEIPFLQAARRIEILTFLTASFIVVGLG